MSRNPVRGCGSKKPGAYIESGEGSSAGILRMFAMFFGEHVDGGENLTLEEVADRGQFVGDLPASILHGRYVEHASPATQAEQRYNWLGGHLGVDYVIFDYIGGSNYPKSGYSAWSYVAEVSDIGISRRIDTESLKQYADVLAQYGAILLVAVHKLPLFQDEDELHKTVRLISEIGWPGSPYEDNFFWPIWNDENYSLFSLDKESHNGWKHGMTKVIWAIDRLACEPELVEEGNNDDWGIWKQIDSLIKAQPKVKQPFMAGWLTKLTFAYDSETGERMEELDALMDEYGAYIDPLDLHYHKPEQVRQGGDDDSRAE